MRAFSEYDLLEFVSSGCKAYALQMRHKTTGKLRIVMRLRGITLTGDVSKILHYDTFKRCVFKFAERAERMEAAGEKGEFVLRKDLSDDEGDGGDENDWTIELVYPNFLQPSIRHGHVTSRPMKKIYRPVVSKGIVTRGMKIKDFGAR